MEEAWNPATQAATEAFFSLLEWEVLSRHDFQNIATAQAIGDGLVLRLLQPHPPPQHGRDEVPDQLRERCPQPERAA
jgi:hypothetical protein